MFKEFRHFIARGNVIDLAVAVIVGAAFGTVVTSLTADLIMPAIGAVFGGLDFSSHFIRLGPIPAGFKGDPGSYGALKAAGVAMLGYGQFVTALVNFLIIAFMLFLIVRAANRLSHKPEEAGGPTEIELLAEIRDELRRRNADHTL